jgi:hypothetical protein
MSQNSHLLTDESLTFEDIEIEDYNRERPAGSRWCLSFSGLFKNFFGLFVSDVKYESVEMVDLSESEPNAYEIDRDYPTQQRGSSSCPENDFDGGPDPAMDSAIEISDDKKRKHIVPQIPDIIVNDSSSSDDQTNTKSGSESDNFESSEENEQSQSDEEEIDQSNMITLESVNVRRLSTFKFMIGKQMLSIREMWQEYRSVKNRLDSSPEKPTEKIQEIENIMNRLDSLTMWYRGISSKLDDFNKKMKKYPNRKAVFITHHIDGFLEFVEQFIRSKQDTAFLRQTVPNSLPVPPSLPQILDQ